MMPGVAWRSSSWRSIVPVGGAASRARYARRIDQPMAFPPVPARCASKGYCRQFQATADRPWPGKIAE
jgi:hypothetical protein